MSTGAHSHRLSISDAQLDRLRDIVQDKTGLTISSSRRREVREKVNYFIEQEKSIDRFLMKLNSSDALLEELVNALTIGESYFFRNRPHFQALQTQIIPFLMERNKSERRLKIWSAGCSTGEEPYSLAILLQEEFPQLKNWEVRILATDINTDFIQRAKAGKYTRWSFRGVEDNIINKYFHQSGANEYTLNESIRSQISFFKLNLATIPQRVEPMYQNCDLIVCRNVLIYFASKLSTAICEVFSDSLKEQGYLLLGHSESFPSLKNLKTIYSHATYYYHKQTEADIRSKTPPSRMSLVPGLGPYDPAKMIMPWSSEDHFSDVRHQPGDHPLPFSPLSGLSLETQNAIEEDLKKVRDYSMEGELTLASHLLSTLERTEAKIDFRVYFLKALVADQQNEYEEAMVHLKQSIFLNKEFVIGHYYQGVIAERSGDIRTASRGYRNACKLAEQMRPDVELGEGGGIRAGRLLEIATERLKELELQNG